MQSMVVKAEKRGAVGGGHVKRLRQDGVVPAVIYGKEIDSQPVQLSMSDLRDLVHSSGRGAFFTLKLDGKEHAVIIKDIQYDAVNSSVLHVDLQKVSLTEKIQSDVSIRLMGRDKVETGRKVLVHQLDQITVKCLPQNTPSYFEADVSGLDVGDSLTVGEIELPEDIELINDPGEVIASVSEVREIVEEEPEAGEVDILEPVEAEGEAEEEEEKKEEEEKEK